MNLLALAVFAPFGPWRRSDLQFQSFNPWRCVARSGVDRCSPVAQGGEVSEPLQIRVEIDMPSWSVVIEERNTGKASGALIVLSAILDAVSRDPSVRDSEEK